jgi:MscS family membrane protein
VQTILRLLTLVGLVVLIIYAADFLGVPLTPVVAGLGVGGLAIALAVRPTLENIIGGLTLFADKPVRIGDFCRFGSELGTVEEIGLRSTRLRRLDDMLVSVPNADFSQRELTNYSRCRQRLYRTTLGLRMGTTPAQLRAALDGLREMLADHPDVSPDWLHVRFHGFGAYALEVEIFAYVRTPDWLEYRAIREDINLRIMEVIEAARTRLAFPSQTAYLGRDDSPGDESARPEPYPLTK